MEKFNERYRIKETDVIFAEYSVNGGVWTIRFMDSEKDKLVLTMDFNTFEFLKFKMSRKIKSFIRWKETH